MLIFDITPMAINKTAMFYIIRDTVKYFIESGREVRLCSLLGFIDVEEFKKNNYYLLEQEENKIKNYFLNLLGNNQQDKIAISNKIENCIIVSFDPLYFLFYKISSKIKYLVYVLDLTPFTRPEWHVDSISQKYKQAFEKLYIKECSILSISDSTTRDLWANYGLGKEKVTTVNLYNRISKNIERKPKKRFLFVGSLEERKNLVSIIKAFELSKLDKENYELRIVGGNGKGSEIIQNIANNTKNVILLGKLSDSDLELEYSQCYCLVYPSLWEGFGLPAIEALSQEIPLIVSDGSALKDIVDNFALKVDPCNVENISRVMKLIVSDNNFTKFDKKALRLWLEKFTFNHYIKNLDNLITKVSNINIGNELQIDNIKNENKISLLEKIKNCKKSLMNRVRKLFLYSVVLESNGIKVPTDSFSNEYLFNIQHARRMKVSNSLRQMFNIKKVYFLPFYIVGFIFNIFLLVLTSIVVKSSINENVLSGRK